MNPGLGYYISLPSEDSVKLNMLVNMKHSIVALLAALHVNIDIIFVYRKRGKVYLQTVCYYLSKLPWPVFPFSTYSYTYVLKEVIFW